MSGKSRNFYAEGNTAKGFCNFYESCIQGISKLFVLKGDNPSVKSLLLKQLSQEFLQQGYDIELLNCAFDNDSLDGIIVPSIKLGIIDGTNGHTLDDKSYKCDITNINLNLVLDLSKIDPFRNKIENLEKLINEKHQKSYNTFAEALKIHDEWEKIYLDNICFDELNKFTEEIINLIFGAKSLEKESKVRDSFFGAATPKGPVDFIQNLTEGIEKRYFIKGRPGSGKSTMLKKLVSAAQSKGFDAEVYHCGFDPNSLDMVILPELSISIFDSTAPHEYFPSRSTDEILDVYKRAIVPDTDDKYSTELNEIISRYSNKAKEATSYLAEAKKLEDEVEKYYADAIDYDEVNRIKDDILKMI